MPCVTRFKSPTGQILIARSAGAEGGVEYQRGMKIDVSFNLGDAVSLSA